MLLPVNILILSITISGRHILPIQVDNGRYILLILIRYIQVTSLPLTLSLLKMCHCLRPITQHHKANKYTPYTTTEIALSQRKIWSLLFST